MKPVIFFLEILKQLSYSYYQFIYPFINRSQGFPGREDSHQNALKWHFNDNLLLKQKERFSENRRNHSSNSPKS
jgi:hypothetical protein